MPKEVLQVSPGDSDLFLHIRRLVVLPLVVCSIEVEVVSNLASEKCGAFNYVSGQNSAGMGRFVASDPAVDIRRISASWN